MFVERKFSVLNNPTAPLLWRHLSAEKTTTELFRETDTTGHVIIDTRFVCCEDNYKEAKEKDIYFAQAKNLVHNITHFAITYIRYRKYCLLERFSK